MTYNAILERPTLNSWKAITSTYHLMIKLPTDYGVGELRGNQVAARECYIAMLEMDNHQQTICIGEQRAVAEPVEELEEVILDDSRPERTTRVGTLASWPVHQELKAFLRDNQDVFAWSHEDMPGIDPSIIVHRLNVSPPHFPQSGRRNEYSLRSGTKQLLRKFESCLRQISSEKCTTPIGWQTSSWLKRPMENGGCA